MAVYSNWTLHCLITNSITGNVFQGKAGLANDFKR